MFKFARSVSDKEVEERTNRLEEIYDVCGGWNDLSHFIADDVRKGAVLDCVIQAWRFFFRDMDRESLKTLRNPS
ncbi:hypothetical protein C5Y97_15670 [Blastopirellula marina]|uniref:Uncharacterized protein n=1 Tax=Blastopirellula marina TaxID=124 RepID=A0A2S8FNA5_9BACT|nr:hypothetical protein C5Y98_15660 [Blastopirellula marina]PTL43459.1 hypothetical protein C5Y97_15670 [Blastopirellula marina]